MIGIIEFKKETHERNRDLARKAKEAICELYESLHGEGVEHRIPKEEFDDRRGRSGMRGGDMGQSDNRGGYRTDYRGDYRGGYRHDAAYPYPPMYPYPFPGMGGQGQFEGRFTE